MQEIIKSLSTKLSSCDYDFEDHNLKSLNTSTGIQHYFKEVLQFDASTSNQKNI